MQVVELGKIIDIDPDLVQKCSICGRYKKKYHSDVRKLDLTSDDYSYIQYRFMTNCNQCFDTSSGEWPSIRAEVARIEHSSEHVKLVNQINLINLVLGNSMPVDELIAALQALPSGSRVLIGQSGYYADGRFADIYKPELYECPVENVYSIGFSSQSA